ncbi:uncharacterized protein K441DRAFT_661690 [Cenococcum geophilum 1.58]|uniref:uncharacterized protein n=1 Tax=Cenococcum geophilum 1.58 TaxID=794803 RepID=UPI00358FED2F|nr:hypothetical protein K441DRAFT_661690 [Cenococcum geophilum 1.58]
MRISPHLACVTSFCLGRSLSVSSPNFRAHEGTGSFLEPYFLYRDKSVRPLCISSRSSHASAPYLPLKARADELEQKIITTGATPMNEFGDLEKHNEGLEQHNKELEKRNREEMEWRMKALEQELETANTDAVELPRHLDRVLEHRN